MRKAAGLTQRQLAKRLKREHSFVSRIELGERRLDVVEFYWVCRACDQDPKSIYGVTKSLTYKSYSKLMASLQPYKYNPLLVNPKFPGGSFQSSFLEI